MIYRHLKITPQKRELFNSKFSTIYPVDIAKFSSYGVQPLMKWQEDENTLEISKEFLDQLPKIVRADIEELIDNLR